MVRQRNSSTTMNQNLNMGTGRSHWNNSVGRRGNLHGGCYRGSRPYPKLVAKPKFVSYAVQRGTKTEGRPLYSLDTTLEGLRWNAFYWNGRAMKGKTVFHNGCTLFCKVTFANSEPHSFWKTSCNTVKEPHAEIKSLEEIKTLEETRGLVRNVIMLLSYSPCRDCADAIVRFKSRRRDLLQISLVFSAIFQHDEEYHRQGLQHLDSHPGITLRVFTENDWEKLADETNRNYYRNSSRKEQDAFWKHELWKILKRHVEVDMNAVDSSAVPIPETTAASSRKLECCVGIILLLVVILVIAAVIFQLK